MGWETQAVGLQRQEEEAAWQFGFLSVAEKKEGRMTKKMKNGSWKPRDGTSRVSWALMKSSLAPCWHACLSTSPSAPPVSQSISPTPFPNRIPGPFPLLSMKKQVHQSKWLCLESREPPLPKSPNWLSAALSSSTPPSVLNSSAPFATSLLPTPSGVHVSRSFVLFPSCHLHHQPLLPIHSPLQFLFLILKKS